MLTKYLIQSSVHTCCEKVQSSIRKVSWTQNRTQQSSDSTEVQRINKADLCTYFQQMKALQAGREPNFQQSGFHMGPTLHLPRIQTLYTSIWFLRVSENWLI